MFSDELEIVYDIDFAKVNCVEATRKHTILYTEHGEWFKKWPFGMGVRKENGRLSH